MLTTIFKEFTFDAAHYLPEVPLGHKCKNMHGHTYKLRVFLTGKVTNEGWVIDFSVLKEIVNKCIEEVDHKTLNTVQGLENPTCELLAKWFWDKIKCQLPELDTIELYETPTSGVVYKGLKS